MNYNLDIFYPTFSLSYPMQVNVGFFFLLFFFFGHGDTLDS